MATERAGKVVKGLGGLYDVRLDGNERVSCRAKGVLKRDEEKVMVGDNVLVSIDESTPNGIVISEVLKRKNSLIRPPVSNLDYLFIVFAAKKPSPVIETVDKLISIAEYNKITPVLIISKSDLSSDAALEYKKIYDNVGIDSFVTSSLSGDGVGELLEYINKNLKEEQILSAVKVARENGLKGLKIYSMIGIPSETKEDIEYFIELAKKIKTENKGFRIVLFVIFNLFADKFKTYRGFAKFNAVMRAN